MFVIIEASILFKCFGVYGEGFFRVDGFGGLGLKGPDRFLASRSSSF